MRFIGIDLAWSDRNPSGVAGLELHEGRLRLLGARTVGSDEKILAAVREYAADEPAFVAIDAPLTVPNETGRRIAEVEVGRIFRKYHAGAHPANRQRLSQWTGRVRGEDLVALLTQEGFAHDPYIKAGERRRKVFEVYPHPSMVVLFGLDRIIPYKAKPKRSYENLWAAFGEYQQHLAGLRDATPPLDLPASVVEKDVAGVRGKALKTYEDTLDGIFCAYIAAYAWRRPEGCAVLGSLEGGYILTPVPFEDQKSLEEF